MFDLCFLFVLRWQWKPAGQIDLPAMIDFVLLKTGQPDLHYIGHSQGKIESRRFENKFNKISTRNNIFLRNGITSEGNECKN